MAKIISLILLLLMIGVIVHGYIRGADPVIAEYIFIGIAKKIWWAVDGDKVPFIFSKVPLILFLKQICPRLEWDELEGLDKKNEKIKGTDTKKYSDTVDFPSIQSFMGSRDEKVPTLKKYEPVSYDIPVTNQNGDNFVFIFKITYYVFDPMKVIRYPDFKMFGEAELTTQLGPWVYTKSIDDIHNTNLALLEDPEKGMLFDGLDMRTYLDQTFRPLGFEIFKENLQIIDGKDVGEYFKLLQQKKLIEQKALNALSFEEQRKNERITENNDAAQEGENAKNFLHAYSEGVKELADIAFNGEAEIARAQPNLLAKVNHEVKNTATTLIEEGMKDVKTIISNNAARKQRQENNPETQKKKEVQNA